MNHFKNLSNLSILPEEVINEIFKFHNPYKTAFTNDIIKNNVLHNAVKQRYIKNLKEKFIDGKYIVNDRIKSLFNFIFDLNLDVCYDYMDITKITYKFVDCFYTILYNNNIIFNVCIIPCTYYSIRKQHFNFFNKSYGNYLIFMSYMYADEEWSGVKSHHNIGVMCRVNEENEEKVIDSRIKHIDYSHNARNWLFDYDSDEECVLSDYFEDFLFIKDIFENNEYDPKTRDDFLEWLGKYYNSYFKDDYKNIIKITNKRNKKWLKNLI